MSKIALKPNDSGTGTFTLESPNSNTDRTLTLPDSNGGIAVSLFFTTSIMTSDWTGVDPYIASKTISGILLTDIPFADIDLSNVPFADISNFQTDWSTVYRVEASANNQVKFYATTQPTEDLVVQIQVLR